MTEPQPTGAFAWTQGARFPWGAVLRCLPLAAVADHFFTVKNLMLRERADEWDAVAAAIGVAVEDLLLVKQVHEATVAVASADRPRPWPRPEADAIISNDASAAIGVRVADCVPILLADTSGRAVAAIHAGWRGTVRRAAVAGIEALQARYGVQAGVTDCRRRPVHRSLLLRSGGEPRDAFRAAGHHADVLDRWFDPRANGAFHLDLWRATRDQLEGAGIMPGNIHVAGLCTKTHADVLHSYRVAGAEGGRMLGVIRV